MTVTVTAPGSAHVNVVTADPALANVPEVALHANAGISPARPLATTAVTATEPPTGAELGPT